MTEETKMRTYLLAPVRAALPARPEIVKPNVTELEQATGEKIDSPEAALRLSS